jgi:hypothetical protein
VKVLKSTWKPMEMPPASVFVPLVTSATKYFNVLSLEQNKKVDKIKNACLQKQTVFLEKGSSKIF